MNKTIEISTEKLVAALTEGLEHAGDSDWSIYINFDGDIDLRHNTHDLTDWFEIMTLTGMSDIYDENQIYPGEDGYDYAGMAAYIIGESSGYFEPQDDWDDEIHFKTVA